MAVRVEEAEGGGLSLAEEGFEKKLVMERWVLPEGVLAGPGVRTEGDRCSPMVSSEDNVQRTTETATKEDANWVVQILNATRDGWS